MVLTMKWEQTNHENLNNSRNREQSKNLESFTGEKQKAVIG